MVQPIDYLGAQPQVNLGQSLLSGLQAGAAIRGIREESAAKEKAEQRMAQLQADLSALQANPTAKGYADLSLNYPEIREATKQSWDINSEAQKDSEFKSGVQVWNALRNGDQEAALGVLDENIEAMRNSGQDASDLENVRRQVVSDPKRAMNYVGMFTSAADPERWGKVVENDIAISKAPLDIRKSGAEAYQAEAEAAATPERLFLANQNTAAGIRNLDSQISDRAGRLNLDRDKLQSETEAKLFEFGQKQGQLDDGGKKLVNESVISSVASDQAASRALDLAGRLEKEGGGYGVASTAGEWLKRATGQQDAMSALRKEYTRLRNAQAIKDLPPGVATDRDVALALEGFPDASADAATISSFLRGVAKMNQVAAVSENAKAEWVNSVGHLGKARADINIDGVNVPAGTTFTDFSRSYIDQKAQQRGAEQAQTQVQNRSYMRYANPGAQ